MCIRDSINLTFTVLGLSNVIVISDVVSVTLPVHSSKIQSREASAVNLTTVPELYSVGSENLAEETISSLTLPSPWILIVKGYFLFTKLAVKFRFWFTVIVRGFWVEPLDQLSNTYSEFWAAVIVTLSPELYVPPDRDTVPPSLEVIESVYFDLGETSEDESSFPHDIKTVSYTHLTLPTILLV